MAMEKINLICLLRVHLSYSWAVAPIALYHLLMVTVIMESIKLLKFWKSDLSLPSLSSLSLPPKGLQTLRGEILIMVTDLSGGKKKTTFWGDKAALSYPGGHKEIKGQSSDSLTKVAIVVGSSKFGE